MLLPETAGGLLTLAPLYEALRGRGYTEEGECVNIEGVPVQFLPAYNTLRDAREADYEGTPAKVLRAEHLVAICVQTGRDKDRERVRIFREQAELDCEYLADVLRRHELETTWTLWTT